MIKCPKCKKYPAIHRAEVRVCPKCGDILYADELIRLLEELGISKELIEKIQGEIVLRKFQSNTAK